MLTHLFTSTSAMTTKSTRCGKLAIFEGPDGGGKSTAAKQYAEETGALYVHFPALPQVGTGLARLYVEAMLPALLGYQDVVFDRCWLSEVPYGTVFRGGADRLGNASRRMLERLAMRCQARVILALPSAETCLQNYRARKELEYLDNEQQLLGVYNHYLTLQTALPVFKYNFKDDQPNDIIHAKRTTPHLLDHRTAGNLDAKVLIVGDKFAERKNEDPWYQWPFGSFSNIGCSRWLTDHLEHHGIGEEQLLWVNADELEKFCQTPQPASRHVIALGAEAAQQVAECMPAKTAAKMRMFSHPQHHKRFVSSKPYGLGPTIKQLLSGEDVQ